MKLLMENWREYLRESKLRVFDFDDTLAKTDSKIWITTPTGDKIEMTPAEYAEHKQQPDYEYDFSEFDQVINPREIKQITNILRNAVNAGTKGREIAILTARTPKAEGPIRDYLESLGLDTSKITFKHVGEEGRLADPQDKVAWIHDRIKMGADDVLFFDDSGQNVEAVQKLKDIFPDVKIRTRTVRYAKDIDEIYHQVDES